MSGVLVFDLDDTLFPEHQYVRSGLQAAAAWLEAERGIAGFGSIAQSLFEAGQRGRIFDRALEEMGITPDTALVQKLVQAYREHLPTLTLHDDARWALDHFKGHWRLGLITDGFLVTQRQKVAALGVAPYFDVLIYSDELGRENWKPSPVPYLRCMEALGCDGGVCTYVGDNPTKDFVTAKSLGWRTIQVARADGEYAAIQAEESHRADYRINALYDLEELLR